MSLGKKKKETFLRMIEMGKLVMPTEIIKVKEFSLFADEDMAAPKYRLLRFELLYPQMAENPNGDPIPKQSFRQYVQRDKDGHVFVYTNPKTQKRDVIMKGYQEAIITNTTEALSLQIRNQVSKKYIGFRPFFKDVHVRRCEFIFTAIGSLNKAETEALTTGEFIVFKETKPDLDNLQKLLWDAFEDSGVFTNDSRIASINGAFKRYGLVPGVIIELEGQI